MSRRDLLLLILFEKISKNFMKTIAKWRKIYYDIGERIFL